MDLLDVGVATDDVLDAVQILSALVDNQVGAVIRKRGRDFERHARTGEEVLNRDFFRTLAVAGTGATRGGTTERTGRAATGGSACSACAEAGHLEDGGGGQRVDFRFQEAVAGIFADFDDAPGTDGEAEADALTGVVERLIDRDATKLEVDARILVGGIDQDDVHALLVLVVGGGLGLEEGQGAIKRLIADDEAFGELDGLHLLNHGVVAVGAVDLDVFTVEDFGELPGLVKELEKLTLSHAAVPLARVLRQHLADTDLVGLGLGIIRLILEYFAIGIEGALVVAVEIASATFHEQLVDLVVLHAETWGELINVAIRRIVALGGEFLLQADDAGVARALEVGVLGNQGGGLDHVARLDGDESTTCKGRAFGILDAILEVAVGEAGVTQGTIGGVQVVKGLVKRFGRALSNQALGIGNHIALLA